MTAESKGNNQVENLGAIIGGIRPETAAVLDRALSGEDITSEEAVVLFGAEGQEYNAMVMTADELRRRTVGDIVTYVVNRNINFTNVCIKGCGFCAFSRDFREDEGYLLPTEEIIRRAKEAWDYGATEVCVQAGLPPKMEGDLYIRLCEALKKELPDPWLLAGRGTLRLHPVRVDYQAVFDRVEGRRSRQSAGYFRRSAGPRVEGQDIPRPHHSGPMDRGDHHRP